MNAAERCPSLDALFYLDGTTVHATQVLVAQAGVPRGDAARGGEVPVPLRQPVGSLLEGAVPRGAPVKVGPLQVD